MGQKYRVIGQFEVAGKKYGELIDAADHPDVLFDALVEGGHVELAKKSDDKKEEPEQVVCEACKNEGKKVELDAAKLPKHYADEHPALVAPTV